MSKVARVGFLVCSFAFLTPPLVSAWSLNYEIYGSIVQAPAMYSGVLTSGGDGILELAFNDDDWPVEPQARFTYIWATYFEDNYGGTPGAKKWTGQIPGRFYIETTNAVPGYNGSCRGGVNAKFTIRDLNGNAILDDVEKFGDNMFDGRLSKLCGDEGTGEMECTSGWGAIASNYFSFTYPPDVDTLYDGGSLYLSGCPSAIEPNTWGTIKSMYE